jgi:hypothetical protein
VVQDKVSHNLRVLRQLSCSLFLPTSHVCTNRVFVTAHWPQSAGWCHYNRVVHVAVFCRFLGSIFKTFFEAGNFRLPKKQRPFFEM